MRCLAPAIPLLLSLLAGTSPAAVRVSGPASCPAGTMVELRAASDVPGAAITWLTVAATEYRSYELRDGSAVVLFIAKQGVYEFACIELATDAVGKPAFTITKHRVDVTDSPQPGPGPNPTPVPPNPNPPAPVDKWGLTKIARETAPNNADERSKIRKNYETAASQLGAGGFESIDAAYAKLRELNRNAVGNAAVEGHAWNRFMFATAERMDACEDDGSLRRTPGDFAAAWNAIAKGLE